MNSMADGLPPELKAHIHPDWWANEIDYWAAHGELRAKYDGLWVAFAGGEVLASGRDSYAVYRAAFDSGRHPYVNRVGAEDAPPVIRRVWFPYDGAYPDSPMPRVSAEFRTASGTPGAVLGRVIPDTGADVTVLPIADCQTLGLDPNAGLPGHVVGVGGSVTATYLFHMYVWLDGQECPCVIRVASGQRERLLGRDVLNQMDVLFRGPSGEVVVNP